MFCFFMYLGEPDHHWRGWLGVQDRRWINEVRRPFPKFTPIRTTGKKKMVRLSIVKSAFAYFITYCDLYVLQMGLEFLFSHRMVFKH